MNSFACIFMAVLTVLILALPATRAPLPLMICIWVTLVQKLELSGLNFPVLRVLIAAGVIRTIVRGERPATGFNSIDLLMVLWTLWNVLSCLFHKSSVLAFRLGTIYDLAGVYYLLRTFLRNEPDVCRLYGFACLACVPLAATMLVEKFAGYNPLGAIGFGVEQVVVTNNHFRASGSFAHPILAGTVGAVCLPMAISLWRKRFWPGWAGIPASLGMVFASGSSGPVLSTLFVTGALVSWKIRTRLRMVRWLAVGAIALLDLLMNAPVYFLMARIDITGGSTGYFRAQLIKSAIEHLDEWWFSGTDYTRHWMPSGIAGNADHTDMTNYYIQMGVWGGLPLMFLFMALLTAGFIRTGKVMRAAARTGADPFLAWVAGCVLFGNAATFISISYFDQSVIFVSLSLACIASLRTSSRQQKLPVAPAVGVRAKQRRFSAGMAPLRNAPSAPGYV